MPLFPYVVREVLGGSVPDRRAGSDLQARRFGGRAVLWLGQGAGQAAPADGMAGTRAMAVSLLEVCPAGAL